MVPLFCFQPWDSTALFIGELSSSGDEIVSGTAKQVQYIVDQNCGLLYIPYIYCTYE